MSLREVKVGRQKFQVKENLLDKVIATLSPERGARRLQAKLTMALVGGYKGASKRRRQTQSWVTSGGDADTDILLDLPALRERSRDLVRNAPIATGAINTATTNVVGSGLKLYPQIDADFLGMTLEQKEKWEADTLRRFNLWAKSKNCDIERTLNFFQMQELVFRSAFENGDTFCNLPRKAVQGLPGDQPLRLQLIEADRVCNESFQRDGDKLAGGVERDDDGAPIRYHILKQHPGNMLKTKSAEWVKIDAFGQASGLRNILHLYRPLRPGQSRGVPDLAPAIEPLRQLEQYTDAELTAAVVSGMFTVFVKSASGAGMGTMGPTSETGGSSTDEDYKLSAGAIVEMAEGDSIETANPGRPNANFDPFWVSMVRQIGMSLEIPFEILVKHFSSSYSASRAAMLEAWRFFKNRRQWLGDDFCQEVYTIWLYIEVAEGRIAAPGFLRDALTRQAYLGAQWIGPGRGMINEKVEIDAAE